ncbi:hypothetical protein GcLGCM259_1951 [Glutamicibacter creatinolyticus]|uniref:Histone acetyltransferase Rv0428c-like SH3 domain-containing protein n=1 Tax=Glutamicibacter creatinolyticus TaxID=162496 RepID=A0A5B7WU88_9MICC|nr:hypothetical protein GcLGCM259_1951 [Glutamicibacter creatinolyticus]
MLNIDDLRPGDRVVLRYRLDQPAPTGHGETLTDALGEIVTVTETSVSVQTRREVVTVKRSRITHAKRVPPPPPRRARRPQQQ